MNHDTDLMTEELLQKVALGDGSAVDRLFQQHRPRIRQMIQMRLDPRITSRVDPSDIVQETLAEAHQRLTDYLRDRPLPFYLWLRKLAWDQLCDAHRRHIRAQKRSVLREDRRDVGLSDESAGRLASRVLSLSPTASQAAIRKESRLQVRQALDQLSAVDREILLMRHVEQMSLEEIAAANDIPVGTAKSRIFRALEKLHRLLEK